MKKRIKTGLVVSTLASAALFVGSQAFAEELSYEIHYSGELRTDYSNSAHADNTSEAFVHWDGDGAVPSRCAKCHTSSGYMDHLGVGTVLDGSGNSIYEPTANSTWTGWVGDTTAYSVEYGAALGQVVECAVCHDYMDPSSHHPNAAGYPPVIFPSGANVTNPEKGGSFSCMVCHQGRASGVDVDQMITDANDTTGKIYSMDDTDANVTFINVHYAAAGATLYGAEVNGGYQYAGKSYDHKFDHVDKYNTCAGCHDPHSLELIDSCSNCHLENDAKDIRQKGSVSDYDGDGDNTEGIAYEIAGLGNTLYEAIQVYAANVSTPIIYDSHSYPYWFVDSDADGEVDAGESSYGNQYNNTNGWTPRMAKAAYNMQFALKDSGGFAHNGKYIIQLLYDSIEDLASNAAVAAAIDVGALTRGDGTHFDGSSEAFRHWDAAGWNHAAGEVPNSCAKCHGEGLPDLLATGTVNATAAQPDGMSCANCHVGDVGSGAGYFALRNDDQVDFPSGDQVSLNSNSNLCMECHAGRNAGSDVSAASFTNIHYAVAGASLFGADGGAGYHFLADGNYSTQNVFRAHPGGLTTCTGCHMQEGAADHSFEADLARCNHCHVGATFEATRQSASDNVTALETALEAQIQTYATANSMNATYLGHYPYWDGTSTWDLNLAGAAYNLQFSWEDHGGYIHNASYIQQVLYDSIVALGGTPTVARPAPQGGTWTAPESEEGGFNFNIHNVHNNNPDVNATCTDCHSATNHHAVDATADGITAVVHKTAHNDCNLWAVDVNGDFYCADNGTAEVLGIQSCSTVATCHGSAGSDVYDENGTATRDWGNGADGNITDENYADYDDGNSTNSITRWNL